MLQFDFQILDDGADHAYILAFGRVIHCSNITAAIVTLAPITCCMFSHCPSTITPRIMAHTGEVLSIMAVCSYPTRSTALNNKRVATTYKTALPDKASHPGSDAGQVNSATNKDTRPTTAVALSSM